MIDTAIYCPQITASLNCDQSNYNHKKIRIRKILFDHYDQIVQWDAVGKTRPCILDNVQKALICSTVYMGSDYFECPSCGNFNIIPRTCHGNLCQKCGYKRSRLLANSFSSMAVDVPHRHIVFTIPEELRNFFFFNRPMLNILFIAARNTMVQVFNKSIFDRRRREAQKKRKKFIGGRYIFKDCDNARIFGMVATLHTFGRSLQWNPHIHALVSEACYDRKLDKLIRINYFNFTKLRKTFQYELLRLMKDYLGSSFTSTQQKAFEYHPDGFYVYAPKDESSDETDTDSTSENIRGIINYFLRYTGRTPMAESRIDNYDSENDTVDWWYIDHSTEKRVNVHDSSLKFIAKLLMHCPDENFKGIRYYGFYANATKKILDRVHELTDNIEKTTKIKRKKIKTAGKNKLKYRTMMIDTFNRDPLKCSCGHIMEFIYTDNPFSSFNESGDKGGERNDRRYRDRCIHEMQKMRIRTAPS